MPRKSGEVSEELRKKVVEAHKAGKGYKLISKALGLPKSTIRSILCKWKQFGTVVNLPRSGRPPKIPAKTRKEIIREVMKNPSTSSKELQAVLASANVCVHKSTIRRILGIHGRPTLSRFEDVMALRTTSRDEEEIQETSAQLTDHSEGFTEGIKVKEEPQCFDEHASVSNNHGKAMKVTVRDCHDEGNKKSTDSEDDSDGDSIDDIYRYDDDEDGCSEDIVHASACGGVTNNMTYHNDNNNESCNEEETGRIKDTEEETTV